jgi:GNAT superfamily N-acetyltransferase
MSSTLSRHLDPRETSNDTHRPPGTRVKVVAAPRSTLDELVDLVADRYRHFDRTELAASYRMPELFPERLMLMAVDADRIVGLGEWARPVYFGDGWLSIRVVVRDDCQGRGVGGLLWAAVLDALPAGTGKVSAVVMDNDPRSLAVSRRWGFAVEGHPIHSQLNLDAASTAPPTLPDGVSMQDCSELDFSDPGAVQAMLTASNTSPEAVAGMRMTVEDLSAAVPPGATPVGVLVRVDALPVGIAFGVVDENTLKITYTGVHRHYRRRGLARLAKQHLHAAAARHGADRTATFNDEHNTAIRALNADLGYTVTFGFYRVAQPVAQPVIRERTPALARQPPRRL